MNARSHIEPQGQRRRESRVGALARARLVAIPVWGWVAGIVVVSTALQIQAGRQIQAPFVFGDELIYSELARSFAATGHFALRGIPNSSYGILYPILIAPAYAVAHNLGQAYAFAKAINAVLMSLAAVPAFLIARRVLPRHMALLASAFAVAIPSLVYTRMILTESAFYPAFLVAVLMILRALERPSSARQLAALAVIGVAFLVRAQGIVLVPIYASAVLTAGWFELPGRSALRVVRNVLDSYRTTWLSLVAGGALVTISQLARGHSPADLLGAYRVVVGDTNLEEIPRWFLYHAADLDLYLGIVPFAACCVIVPLALAGSYGRPHRLFAAVLLWSVFWMTVLVAAFSSSVWGLGRLHERNLFYVAPLMLIGFFVWIEAGAPRPRWLALGAATTAALLPPLLPFSDLVHAAVVDALALLPWATTVLSSSDVPLAIAVLTVILGLVFLFLPRNLAALLIGGVALNFYIIGAHASWHARDLGRAVADVRVNRDWIDKTVGPKPLVASIWFPNRTVCATRTGPPREDALWENEFFNRSVRRMYFVAQAAPDNLPATRLFVDRRTHTLQTARGHVFSPRFVVVGEAVRLRAPVVARDRQTRTVLYRYRPNVRVVFPANCPNFAKETTAS
jgi:hypothetical protein